MSNLFIALAILGPLAIYLWAGLRAKPVTSYQDMLNTRQAITPIEFSSSSVAYGFQIATVSIFLAWGYLYPLPALLNALFWGLGIILFRSIAWRVQPFISSTLTVHGFVAERHGKSVHLRTIVGAMTVLGYLGVLLAELIWGSSVFGAFVTDSNFMYGVTFGLGVFVLLYLVRGGQVSVIRTDVFQLLFSYAGFIAAITYILFFLVGETETDRSGAAVIGIAFAVLLATVFLVVRRQRRMSAQVNGYEGMSWRILQVLLIGGAILSIYGGLSNSVSIASVADAVGEMSLLNPGLDGWSLISICALPFFWQFVDFPNWQRIGAGKWVKNEDGSYDVAPLEEGLKRYALESPITWMFAVLVGILLRFSDLSFDNESIWNVMVELPAQILQSGIGGAFVAGLFASGIIAIILSTFDSALLGATTALVYDVLPGSRGTAGEDVTDEYSNKKIRNIAIVAASGFVIGGLFLYYVLSAVDIDVVGILFSAYGFQISFVPVVVGALFLGARLRLLPAGWAIASVVLGAIGGLIGVWGGIIGKWSEFLPPLFALGVSSIVYYFFVWRKAKNG